MKTFNQFITEAPSEAEAAKMAPDMDPAKRRRALERNARNQAMRSTPATPQKSLPAAGGALAKTTPQTRGTIQKAAPNALAKKLKGALVKKTSSGPSKEAVGKSTADKAARTKPSAGYMGKPDTTLNKRKKPKQSEYDKEMERIKARKDSEKKPKGNLLGKAAKGGLNLAGKTAKGGLKLAGKVASSALTPSGQSLGTSQALSTQNLSDTTDN